MAKAEILSDIPESGGIIERWYDATGSCVWIRFEDDLAQEWAGVFGSSGLSGPSKVTLFAGGRLALVIAGGQGYVVNVGTGEMCHRTDCECLIDLIAVPESDVVVACDFTNLFTYSSSGLVWRSDRIALDGIEFDRAAPGQVHGWVDHGKQRSEFCLDVNQSQFVEGPWQFWDALQKAE